MGHPEAASKGVCGAERGEEVCWVAISWHGAPSGGSGTVETGLELVEVTQDQALSRVGTPWAPVPAEGRGRQGNA